MLHMVPGTVSCIILAADRQELLNGITQQDQLKAEASNRKYREEIHDTEGEASVVQWLVKFVGAVLSRVRTPPPAPLPDGGPESLKSPCCGPFLTLA
ncbi:hypothetical protein PoB_007710300 [Plakobranchus ocellatus]|uniref:Uncharacterized protein n=1 Tax=Plakobranchus ocellatus TaxID=259542 RepID=A0AAV4E208_9GAST|nr:hypothetical protein PoB_007710300 [Plakobranchus ocellatus]